MNILFSDSIELFCWRHFSGLFFSASFSPEKSIFIIQGFRTLLSKIVPQDELARVMSLVSLGNDSEEDDPTHLKISSSQHLKRRRIKWMIVVFMSGIVSQCFVH